MPRRNRLPMLALCSAVALCAGFGARDAHACGTPINVYPIRPNTGLYVFPGFTQQLVTANLGNSWQFAWQGGSGVTHFSGRLRDAAGAVLNVVAISSGATITRIDAAEVEFSATWNSAVDRNAGTIGFVTGGNTAIFELHNDSNFSITSYPKPNLTEGYPIGNPFALTLAATESTLADPAVQFCNDFE